MSNRERRKNPVVTLKIRLGENNIRRIIECGAGEGYLHRGFPVDAARKIVAQARKAYPEMSRQASELEMASQIRFNSRHEFKEPEEIAKQISDLGDARRELDSKLDALYRERKKLFDTFVNERLTDAGITGWEQVGGYLERKEIREDSAERMAPESPGG